MCLCRGVFTSVELHVPCLYCIKHFTLHIVAHVFTMISRLIHCICSRDSCFQMFLVYIYECGSCFEFSLNATNFECTMKYLYHTHFG